MKKWVQAARPYVMLASVLPAVFGGLMAMYEKGIFKPGLFVLTLLGVALVHFAANLINDYFDFISGVDLNNPEGVFPFSGGSRVIVEGKLEPSEALQGTIFLYALSLLISAYLYLEAGPWVLILTLIAIITSVFYVSPRYNIINLGLGELIVGLDFGVLTAMGAYYVQTGTFSWSSILASLPLALLIALILLANEFPDYAGDKLASKKTFVVRWGKKRAADLIIFLLVLTVLDIILNAALGFISFWSLAALLTMPLIICAALTARRYYDDVPNMITSNICIINSHIFINTYLVLACFKFSTALQATLFTLVLFFQVVTMRKLGVLNNINKAIGIGAYEA